MAAPSSNSAIRKALRQFEDGLQTFCGQLATETAEVGAPAGCRLPLKHRSRCRGSESVIAVSPDPYPAAFTAADPSRRRRPRPQLRRNVENQPCTGAYYRNVLEDLQQRADAVGQELQALSALSLDAVSIEVRGWQLPPAVGGCRGGASPPLCLSPISLTCLPLQELVGHSVALYCQNYEQVRATLCKLL